MDNLLVEFPDLKEMKLPALKAEWLRLNDLRKAGDLSQEPRRHAISNLIFLRRRT